MIKQPIDAFRGQASNLEIARNEIRNTKRQTLDILSKGIGKDIEEIEKDINRPKYFNPWEAVEYGLIDQAGTFTRTYIHAVFKHLNSYILSFTTS